LTENERMDSRSKASLWRERAHEIRSIAEAGPSPHARDELQRLAARWDEMADELETRKTWKQALGELHCP